MVYDISMPEEVDLSELSVSEVERQLGYLMREQLSKGVGCLVLRTRDRLVVVDSLPVLEYVPLARLAEILLAAGLAEDAAVRLLWEVAEYARTSVATTTTGAEDSEVPGQGED